MDTTSHQVRDISVSDRVTLERLIGQPLSDDQQVVIQVLPPSGGSEASPRNEGQPPASVPAYWRVLEGLTETQLDQLDATLAHRPAFSRPSEPA